MLVVKTTEANFETVITPIVCSQKGNMGGICKLGNKQLTINHSMCAGPPGTQLCKIINKVTYTAFPESEYTLWLGW